MTKLIIALGLSLPFFASAQKLELSLKGGTNPNNFYKQNSDFAYYPENPFRYAGSASVTVGLPANVRVGVSVSAYNLEYSAIIADELYPGTTIESVPRSMYKIGAPVMPVEIMVVKRFNIAMFSIDAGLIGGASFANKTTFGSIEGKRYTYDDSKPWYIYGFVVGGQINLNKRFAVGIEAQPKKLHVDHVSVGNVLMIPVMLKASVRI